MIEVINVTKNIGKHTILNNLSFTLEHGVYGLLGPNGAGKTTLMRCLTDLYPINHGEILINGKKAKKRETSIGYLPQFFGLYKELSVWDSMKYFCALKKIKKAAQDNMITECLEKVNMIDRKKVKGKKLSGGMIRRVGIAQALLNSPPLILFDEPTAGLDPEERIKFKNIISGLGTNETVIISTHIVDDIEAACDHVIVMNNGNVIGIYTCEELRQKATDKVFSCSEKDLTTSDCYIEKCYEENGTKKYRVLSNNPSEHWEKLSPTLEDGYMCIIKEIGVSL